MSRMRMKWGREGGRMEGQRKKGRGELAEVEEREDVLIGRQLAAFPRYNAGSRTSAVWREKTKIDGRFLLSKFLCLKLRLQFRLSRYATCKGSAGFRDSERSHPKSDTFVHRPGRCTPRT